MSEINSIETYIVRYLYGEITEDELLELGRWLEESSENMEEFTRLKILHDFIRNRQTAMGEGDIDRSWRKMKRKMTGRTLPAAVPLDRPERKKIWPGRLLKYVAAATVTAMSGFGAGDHFGRRSRPAEEIRPAVYSEVHVPRGGKPNTVILSDGSVVRLNAATTLRYPSDFDGARCGKSLIRC